MTLLKPGDLVRFVSPASRPAPDAIERRTEVLQEWGLRVEIAPHAFDKLGYLAGTDEARLADLTNALLDQNVRAVFTTRGGKGSYRIAHRLPFDQIADDPKPLIGFSDITALQMSLLRESAARSIHGGLTGGDNDQLSEIAASSLRVALMGSETIVVASEPTIQSASLTTGGPVCGPLIGGSLTMMATAAGWALPSLRGAILLIESDGIAIGQFERDLTMLVRAGHLNGIVGVAIGHINGTPPNPPIDAIGLLTHHLEVFGVPMLGGLPIGHHPDARSVLIGAQTRIDPENGTLTQPV